MSLAVMVFSVPICESILANRLALRVAGPSKSKCSENQLNLVEAVSLFEKMRDREKRFEVLVMFRVFRAETKGRFCKRVVLANVPLFWFLVPSLTLQPSLLFFLAFFVFRVSLLSWCIFLSFPKILAFLQREKTLSFPGFPCFSPKTGLEGQALTVRGLSFFLYPRSGFWSFWLLVPSFRFLSPRSGFGSPGSIRQNHPFGNHPFANPRVF